jgi:hypothetical protein
MKRDRGINSTGKGKTGGLSPREYFIDIFEKI